MASIPETQAEPTTFDGPLNERPVPRWDGLGALLMPLASLKLTVAMFAASIFIVFAGTLAQVNNDIWHVIDEYFRVDFRSMWTATFPYFDYKEFFVRIDFKIFFPKSFFPESPVFPDYLVWMKPFWPDGTPDLLANRGFYFPKGWTIGIIMTINLVAAHTLRFKVQASGSRLTIGSIVLLFGSVLTYLVILSGSNPDGLQANPLIKYENLRLLMLTTIFGCCGVTFYSAIVADKPGIRWLNIICTGLLICTGAFIAIWEASDAASMRILYQLVKATFASLVLLAGCIMVFKKRAGIVLLHAGIGLMMFYDVLVGTQHIESQMTIVEGETVHFSRDIRSAELAVIDRSGQDEDKVTVIAASELKPKTTISDDRLPFDIEILKYYKNSDVRGLQSFGPKEDVPENLATRGIGKNAIAVEAANVKGTDTGGNVDFPTAYVKLTSKGEFSKDLGVYMLSSIFDVSTGSFGETQQVKVGDNEYEIALRFVRYYNDYSVTLKDVQKNDYMGTSQVKDYSSFITVEDPSRDLDFEHRIWMNNPMRYAGKTFYQSSYNVLQGGKEATTLQVVDNAGWMTPYVSCMIVWVGMMYHFGLTLLRFLSRRASRRLSEEQTQLAQDQEGDRTSTQDLIGWVTAGVLVASIFSTMFMLGRPPSHTDGEFDVAAFGELPMWYKGRPMPIDSFARNAMLRISDRESWKDDKNTEDEEDDERRSAVSWVLDVMADEQKAGDLRVFRIENDDVREAIGLERRKGFMYSKSELSGALDVIIEQASAASAAPADKRTLIQRKIIELANRMRQYTLIESSIGRPFRLPAPETEGAESTQQRVERTLQFARLLAFLDRQFAESFNSAPIPLIVPTHLGSPEAPPLPEFETSWEPVIKAHALDQYHDEFGTDAPPAVAMMTTMIDAYRDGDTKTFNETLSKYEKFLAKHAGDAEAALPLAKTNFEATYNRYEAFTIASWLYVLGFVLAVLGWLFAPNVFQRSAFWTLLAVFAIHTAALIGRIYISGRPPVTNLYSSAIFIGWAVVLGSLILEMTSRLGLGNVVAAMSGFLTLRIADGLASDGDTFVVLEAVLDTQFWLATHVVCITLGYAATYLAGMFGVLYLFGGIFSPNLGKDVGKEITRMTYGVLCFATFFSLVGTVLGGLWADDSWGRFWGWDPKENGALIIVLWNALVLHARWGNMIKGRGMAILSVIGNIVVSWSWFGVNELGVGLHSYGFTEGRLAWLALFVISQLAIVAIGLIPIPLWRQKSSGLS